MSILQILIVEAFAEQADKVLNLKVFPVVQSWILSCSIVSSIRLKLK